MGESEQTRQTNFILPPRAGNIASLAVSAAAGSQDMSLIDNQAKDASDADKLSIGLVGCYVIFESDGGDTYVIFGPTQASVTGGNVPVIATNGVNAAGVAQKIPKDVPQHYKITPQDRWIGYIGAGNAQLRIHRASPYPQAC